jgi:aminoglycoside phosphotransferase (APT) family kinase protein
VADRGQELADALARVLGAASIAGLHRLSGGASRETWSFKADGRDLVLRKDPPGAVAGGLAREADLLRAARTAGVPVPDVIASGDGSDGVGAPYIVMNHVDGETIARRILRDDAYASARPKMARQCGEILAAIHSIPTDATAGLPDDDPLEKYAAVYAGFGEPHPTFDLALKWLRETRPSTERRTLVHGDFRNGNLIVGAEGIRSVLDWELAHVGDPMEDLGWLCANAWRFGGELPVGGFGTYDDLVAGYEAVSGVAVDRAALNWWEAAANLSWGVICIAQAATHRSGAVRSVELAAIGRRVCETEWDLLGNFAASRAFASAKAPLGTVAEGRPVRAVVSDEMHDVPTAAELVEAVREFLERDVMTATEGRVQFHTRVAVNVLNMVQRELTLGADQAVTHTERLAVLGVGSERELSDAIASGAMDDRLDEVVAIVRATVRDKLAVANPKYLRD